jgi:O-antigen/teichoic acid export membrane protein
MTAARLFSRLASVASMRLATALLSLSLFWYLARVRGASELGEFALLLGIYAFFQQMPLLGLHLLLVKDIAADAATGAHHLANGLAFAGAASLVLCAGIGLAGTWLYADALAAPIWLVAFTLLPTAVVVVAETYLVARQNVQLYAGVNIAETALRVIASVVALRAGYGLVALTAIFLCGRILAAGAYLALSDVARLARAGRVTAAALREYLLAAPILLGILLLTSTLARFDILLLSALAPARDVGLYSAAYKFYEVALFVPSIIAVVLFPSLAASQREHPERFESSVGQCLWVLVLAGAPCAIALAAAAPLLVGAAFGNEYEVAAPVLQILAGCAVLVALDQVLAIVLLVHGRQDLDLAVLAVAAAFYVVALAVLIPPWGYVGAAIATALATGAQLGARIHCVRSRLGMFRARPLASPGAAP